VWRTAEADVVLLGLGSAAGCSINVQQSDESGENTEAPSHSFRVAGSPYTPKFYGSFQLQDEKHAGTRFVFFLTWMHLHAMLQWFVQLVVFRLMTVIL
jgi:hypothetical protein